ncbi:MAG: cytochrome c [Phycisphaeraceae bacterium]|nr:MAG: cytochrome c [Phycisphaeraceae bacterium]
MIKSTTKTGLVLAAAGTLGVAGLLAGCRGDPSDQPPRQFFPDMDDSPKWKPQVPTEFFADGRAMRPTVPGAVAFARVNMDRDAWLTNPEWAAVFVAQRDELRREEWRIYEGVREDRLEDGSRQYTPEGIKVIEVVDRIPVPVTPALLLRGEERFNIFCAVCHGYEGDGNGTVAPVWAGARPANFHDAVFSDRSTNRGKDGHLFHVAREGLYGPDGSQRMPGYKHGLSVEDSWAIVAHIRVLQAAWDGRLEDVTDAGRRERLAREREDAVRKAGETGGGTP